MIHIKEKKEMEDNFKKAQKPWAKHLTKVEKTKADYHAACKTEKTATNQERNANADSSLSPDQVTTNVNTIYIHYFSFKQLNVDFDCMHLFKYSILNCIQKINVM